MRLNLWLAGAAEPHISRALGRLGVELVVVIAAQVSSSGH